MLVCGETMHDLLLPCLLALSDSFQGNPVLFPISYRLTTNAPLYPSPPSTGHRLAALLLLPKDAPVGSEART